MSNWKKRFSAEGFRITASRRAVMDVLLATSVPLSPSEILEQGRRVHRKLGLVTVYRALALLEHLRCVRRVHHEDGCHAYLPCSPGHAHALICRQCGRAAEFQGSEDLQALIARVEEATGYQVDGHLLQLSGLCPDCQS